jgi:hypothetical protein
MLLNYSAAGAPVYELSLTACGACSLLDHSLFSIGLLEVLHVVLIPYLMSHCSALGYWQGFMCCLFPL